MDSKSYTGVRDFRILFSLLFAFFMGIGSVAIVDANGTLRDQEATEDWVPVNATVLSSEVVWRGCDSDCIVLPEVTYRYNVNDMNVTSERISFAWDDVSDSFLLEEEQWRVVEAFPAGANVTAFVDPDDPFRSVLFRGTSDELSAYNAVLESRSEGFFFVSISPVVYVLGMVIVPRRIRANQKKDQAMRKEREDSRGMLGPMDKGSLDPNPPRSEDVPLEDDVSKGDEEDVPFWSDV